VQDSGRYGYQHLGINPGGEMDLFSASLANALLGKDLQAPVIEMHFPAPHILFQKSTVLCLAGADFAPMINRKPVSVHQPIAVDAGAILSFRSKQSGARCYLSLFSEWQLNPWLNSYSTNLKAGAGGYKGRRLEKEDELAFEDMAFTLKEEFMPLPWKYSTEENITNVIGFIPGPEWNWLSRKVQTIFLNGIFHITPSSDRMGYRLQGESLEQETTEQLISAAVNFGTVQLLPNGQLIVLMADHQTTGGYPRIASVISTHLPKLAQSNPGDAIRFEMTTVDAAEEKRIKQQQFLRQLQNTCKLKLQNWLDAHRH
jgi:antagonist of KipI